MIDNTLSTELAKQVALMRHRQKQYFVKTAIARRSKSHELFEESRRWLTLSKESEAKVDQMVLNILSAANQVQPVNQQSLAL